jgi:hypothetical protein
MLCQLKRATSALLKKPGLKSASFSVIGYLNEEKLGVAI